MRRLAPGVKRCGVSGSLWFELRQNAVEGGHHPVGIAEFLGFPFLLRRCLSLETVIQWLDHSPIFRGALGI